ncbi:MAG: flavin reductase family protein [Crocinitomicaceae bacterium]
MKYFSKADIEKENRIKRLNIINAISGIKPGNLIGTKSKKNGSNLAVFSSVVHLGSSPALLGFILRPTGNVLRNTYSNILETGKYTINHIHISMIEKAHYTSAKFDESISEFKMCGLTESYLHSFEAPFVEESVIKMGMNYIDTIPIPVNGTKMVIGEIQHLILPNESISEEGYVDLSLSNSIGVGGLNNYYELNKTVEFPFARPSNIPDFN